jgi:hypothetical protein
MRNGIFCHLIWIFDQVILSADFLFSAVGGFDAFSAALRADRAKLA